MINGLEKKTKRNIIQKRMMTQRSHLMVHATHMVQMLAMAVGAVGTNTDMGPVEEALGEDAEVIIITILINFWFFHFFSTSCHQHQRTNELPQLQSNSSQFFLYM
jgi:hypothetical protein